MGCAHGLLGTSHIEASASRRNSKVKRRRLWGEAQGRSPRTNPKKIFSTIGHEKEAGGGHRKHRGTQMSLTSANIELCSAIVGYVVQYTILFPLAMCCVC